MAGGAAQIDDHGARQALGALGARLRDFTVPMKLIGVHMLRSIQQNFDAGGRPTPWAPSKRVLRFGGKTLVDKGQLEGSITPHAEPDRVRLGTTKVYARIHQLGGEIRQARRVRLKQQRGRGVTRIRKVRATIRTGVVIHMPARPFLVVQPGDVPIIRGILRDYLAGRPSAA